MPNAFSGGHKECQKVAQLILEAGGNAFDAAIATHLAMFIAEPCMASAGGNGFALIKANGDKFRFLDFFSQTPKVKTQAKLDYHSIVVNFGTETEEFHIGLASVAVPGTIKALFLLHERYGTMPMSNLVEPAIEMARKGVIINSFQGHDMYLLAEILGHSEKGRQLFFEEGQVKKEGDTIKMPRMADFLYNLAREGKDLFYKGEIARQIEKESLADGGHLRRSDFEAYEVNESNPLVYNYLNKKILLPNGPSKGGAAIVCFLDTLVRTKDMVNSIKTSLELLKNVPELIERINKIISPNLYNLLSGTANYKGTSHFNIVDKNGNAISLTSSIGEGSGCFIKGTDMQLNNMLGEVFLLPNGPHSWVENERMHSMMTPLMVTDRSDNLEFIAGSGGASRIPFALGQVLKNYFEDKLDLENAIEVGRLFYQYDMAQVEAGAETKSNQFPQKNWDNKSLYFGGVHAIALNEKGMMAHGDSRRLGSAAIF